MLSPGIKIAPLGKNYAAAPWLSAWASPGFLDSSRGDKTSSRGGKVKNLPNLHFYCIFGPLFSKFQRKKYIFLSSIFLTNDKNTLISKIQRGGGANAPPLLASPSDAHGY